ncbi:MAG TPA: hypothetical protein VHW44_20280 [Pseudonocardiaceae bacterium]|jgi:hypothetical protein|nr:hypothetical protein [Pseudonocardiaceae bacterium]
MARAVVGTAILSRYLRDCVGYTAYGEQDHKRIGVLLGDVAPPDKKRPDVVDALVALTGAQHDPAAVLTSDPAGIAACLDALPKARTIVVPI